MAVPQSAPVSVGQKENRPIPQTRFFSFLMLVPVTNPSHRNCPGLILRIQSSIPILTDFTSLKPLNLTLSLSDPGTPAHSKGRWQPPATGSVPRRESGFTEEEPPVGCGYRTGKGGSSARTWLQAQSQLQPYPRILWGDPTKEGSWTSTFPTPRPPTIRARPPGRSDAAAIPRVAALRQ